MLHGRRPSLQVPRPPASRRRRVPCPKPVAQAREVRSYEVGREHARKPLKWHLDFHHGSLKVLTLRRPVVAADRPGHPSTTTRDSAGHVQVVPLGDRRGSGARALPGDPESRGLLLALLTDNGSAMGRRRGRSPRGSCVSASSTSGPSPTAVPTRTGKQEAFWGPSKGGLMTMLDGVAGADASIFLNEATQAWMEIEYNRTVHRETTNDARSIASARASGRAPCASPSSHWQAARTRFSPSKSTRSQRVRATARSRLTGCGLKSRPARSPLPRGWPRARWDLGRVEIWSTPRSGTISGSPLSAARQDGQRRTHVAPLWRPRGATRRLEKSAAAPRARMRCRRS